MEDTLLLSNILSGVRTFEVGEGSSISKIASTNDDIYIFGNAEKREGNFAAGIHAGYPASGKKAPVGENRIAMPDGPQDKPSLTFA